MQFTFKGSNPFVKTLKTDRSARIEIDLDPEDVGRLTELNKATGTFTVAIVKDPEL